MKKLFFALLVILYLLIVIGCPPSTPNKDAFGPGPNRDMTSDTTGDGTDATDGSAADVEPVDGSVADGEPIDGSAADGEPIDGSAADGDIGGTGDGDVTPPEEPAAPDGDGGE